MGILSFIASSNFIVVNKELIKQLGLEEAILIGELASEYDYWNKKEDLKDGYFFSTIENVEESTGLSEFKQRKAFKVLQEKEIIDLKIKGIPAKRYVKIREEQVLKLIDSKFFKNSSASSLIIKELDVEKLKGNNNINNNNKNNNINNIYFYDNKLNDIFKEFLQVRKKLKAVNSERAINALINKLNDFDDETKYKMIEQSIIHSWKDVYELKENKIKNQPEWFEKNIKEDLATKEEQEEMEKLINSI